MSYFADMSPYSYRGDDPHFPETVNVGWLSASHPFPKTQPEAGDLDVIWEYCKVRIYQSRGLHACPLCEQWFDTKLHHVQHRDELMIQGDAEILIASKEHGVFAAPNLIFHYMRDHHYAPPSSFLLALRSVDPKPSVSYRKLLSDTDIYWSDVWEVCPEDL